MSDLMKRFAEQARKKKKYRDIPEGHAPKEHVEKSSLVPNFLNLLHKDILEEDFESAMEALRKLTKALGFEDKVNFEVDEEERRSSKIPESIYEGQA